MRIIMRNNIFKWGDMHFLQLLGTAMGTSAACMWATIYCGIHEIDTLLACYLHCLFLYRHFIDGMFSIFISTDE